MNDHHVVTQSHWLSPSVINQDGFAQLKNPSFKRGDLTFELPGGDPLYTQFLRADRPSKPYQETVYKITAELEISDL